MMMRPDPTKKSALEWGDMEEEEWENHLEWVEAKNQGSIRKWEEDSMEWHRLLDGHTQIRRGIDTEHERLIAAWGAELALHQERAAEREAAYQEWVERQGRIFSRWGADVGILYGEMKNTFSRSINGQPIFHTFSILHLEDWERVDAACRRESERMRDIEV